MNEDVGKTIVAIVSASAGVAVTLLLSSFFVADDPRLRAAEQRFSELSSSEARRLKTTFELLQRERDEKSHIEALHRVVSSDSDLDGRLRELYAWWQTQDDVQRAELRELRSLRPQEWLQEMQRRISESPGPDDFTLQLPGSQHRRRPIHVSRQQVDRFLEEALPTDGLSPDDEQLLQTVDPQDLSLARVVVIFGEVYRNRSRNVRGNTMAGITQAVEKHILPADALADRTNPREKAIVSVIVLRSLANQLREDFARRQVVSSEAVEREFAGLATSERIKHMISDPPAAVHSLQTHLKSVDRDTPAGQLAFRLSRFRNIMSNVRRSFPSGRAPRMDRGRETRPGDRRQFGPPRDGRQMQPEPGSFEARP